MTTLKFFSDVERDVQLLRTFDLRSFFGEETYNYFLSLYYPELVGKTHKEIVDFFHYNGERLIREMQQSSEQLKKDWKKCNNFFTEVERVTGFAWKHDTYYCHLSSSFICGGCYDLESETIVSVFPRVSHCNALDTLLHELVHLHFWGVIDELELGTAEDKENTKGTLWHLSEIAVNYPLERIRIGFKPSLHIYKQHEEIWQHIKKYWHLNFKEFIRRSYHDMTSK
ncbi:hypothetical protein GF342_01185 [Candidatus Woesearchaeota archaeon]|nr:hypothetical protein [Candidatus Woesearchaeota archaeon]